MTSLKDAKQSYLMMASWWKKSRALRRL